MLILRVGNISSINRLVITTPNQNTWQPSETPSWKYVRVRVEVVERRNDDPSLTLLPCKLPAFVKKKIIKKYFSIVLQIHALSVEFVHLIYGKA